MRKLLTVSYVNGSPTQTILLSLRIFSFPSRTIKSFSPYSYVDDNLKNLRANTDAPDRHAGSTSGQCARDGDYNTTTTTKTMDDDDDATLVVVSSLRGRRAGRAAGRPL